MHRVCRMTEANVIETKEYGKGKFIKIITGPEFRFSVTVCIYY